MEEKTNLLSQILGETEAVPFAEINGRKVYSFRDGQRANKRRLAEEKLGGKKVEVGQRQMHPDGIHFNRTKADVLVANPEVYFANRVRLSEKDNGKPQLEVVTDYQAIKKQDVNKVPTKNVPVYVLGKTGRNGSGLTLIKKDIISDTEFVNEFKQSIPIMKDGGINTQVIAVFDAIERASNKEEKTEDLDNFFG